MRTSEYLQKRRGSSSKTNHRSEFPPVSVSTKDFRWLHSEGWDGGPLTKYFAANHTRLPLLIFTAPSYVRSRAPELQVLGRWILTKTNSEEPLAWIEAQVITKSFVEVWFFIGCRTDEKWDLLDLHQQQLSLLISSVLISSKADMIYFTFVQEADRQGLLKAMSEEWGELLSVLSPVRGSLGCVLNPEPLRTISIRKCSRAEWQSTSLWKRDRETLSYLVKKLDPDAAYTKNETPVSGRKGARFLKMMKKFLNPLGLGVRR